MDGSAGVLLLGRLKVMAGRYWELVRSPEKGQAVRLSQRLAHGVMWGVLGGVGAKVFTLLASVITARILGKVGFGEYGMAISTVGLFGSFAGLGLGITATKCVAEYREKDPAKAERILGLSAAVSFVSAGAMALVLFLGAPYIAAKTLAAPHLAPALKACSLMLFFTAVNGAQTGALFGFEAFRKNAKLNFGLGLMSLPVMSIGVWRWGLMGAVWASVIISAVTWSVYHAALRFECRKHGLKLTAAGCWTERRILWRYSIPATVTGLLVGPVFWAVNAMMANRPGGYAEIGVYNAANQWRTMLLFIPMLIGQTIVPIMSERYGRGNIEATLKTMKVSMLVSALVVVPVSVGVGLMGPWIMAQYGPSFADGWPVLLVVLATASLMAVMTPVGNFIAASGRMWTGAAMNAGWGAVAVVSAWLFIPMGAVGLALAFLIAYLAHSVWVFVYVYYVLRDNKSVRP